MSIVRAFIALELPDAMQRELDKLSVELRKLLSDLPLRWVRTENIHITLKFLGKTSQEDLARIQAIIDQQARKMAPIQVEFSEFGVFPNAHKPLVLWVGVKAPAELQVLQQGIEESLAEIGYPAEKRGFAPHLTLARVRREHKLANLKRIGEVMASVTLEPSAAGIIDAVTLFRSDLKPGGSVYNPISRSPLLGPQ